MLAMIAQSTLLNVLQDSSKACLRSYLGYWILGAETVDWLLRLMQLQEPNSEVPEPLVPIPAPERAQVASTLPADMGKEALQAIDALKEEDPKVLRYCTVIIYSMYIDTSSLNHTFLWIPQS